MAPSKKLDIALYRKLFSTIPKNIDLRHSWYPSVNLHSFDSVVNGDYELFEVNRSNGCQVTFRDYCVFVVGEEPRDLSEVFLMKKRAWKRRLRELEPSSSKHDALRELKRLRDGINHSITLKMRRYVNHVMNDPLPGFDGERNWLYSGGTVSAVRNDSGSSSVVSSCGLGMSSVCKLEVDSSGQIQKESRFKFKMSDPILQVIFDPISALVCVRQKNNLSILKTSDRGLDMKIKKKVRKSNYFTSAAMAHGKVAISKNLGSIALFDVEVNKLSFSMMPMERLARCEATDSWNQIQYRDHNLMVLRKKHVTQIDVRGDVVNWDWNEAMNDCDDLCNYFESKTNDNLCYFATTHNLFQVDLRQQKKVHQWTHMMLSPPTYGRAVANNSDELIVLQGTIPSETVTISNGKDHEKTQPCIVPGITDALRSAQLHGICLDPDVSQRASYTVTGTTILSNGLSHEQITQNAAGDIFTRKMEPTTKSSPTDWSSWEHFENTAPIRVHPACSEIADMTDAFACLKIPAKPERKRLAPVDWQLGEQVRVDTLHLFKDRMVEPILDAWNIETDMREDVEDTEVVPHDIKVQEWLTRHLDE